MSDGPERQVRVEVVELDDGGTRQIAATGRATELLRERADDVRAAIHEAIDIARTGLDAVPSTGPWGVTSLQATFGLTLTAESGIIVGKASGTASFEIRVTIERTATTP